MILYDEILKHVSSIEITDRGVMYIFSTKPTYYIAGNSYRLCMNIAAIFKYSTRTALYSNNEVSFRIIKTK